MIDTHCHLTFPDFEGRIAEALDSARAEGVCGAITISTTTEDCRRALAVARAHERVWCSAGVHPLYSDKAPHVWENLREVGRDPKCVAWGELGLDNHYDHPPREVQRAVLDEQLAHLAAWRAEGLDKPIVLHCRDAFEDLIPVLERSPFEPSRFVFHCFTGRTRDMRLLLDFGAMVSFTGVVTYNNAKDVQEAARLAPLDRIMVETDAPFLTPAPHRGVRPNEPRFSAVTARFLAALRGEAWDDFVRAIDANTARFFGVDPVG